MATKPKRHVGGRPSKGETFKKVALLESTFESWRGLREELGLNTDNDVASFLINTYRSNLLRFVINYYSYISMFLSLSLEGCMIPYR